MIKSTLLDLASVIRTLRAYYEQYLTLGDLQRKSLIHNRLDILQDCGAEIDQLVLSIEDLERNRLDLMQDLQKKLGQEFTRFSDLIEIIPSPESQILVDEANQLKEILRKATNLNIVNQRLIKSSREFIRSTIAIVTGYAQQSNPENHFTTYSRSGKINYSRSQNLRLYTGSI